MSHIPRRPVARRPEPFDLGECLVAATTTVAALGLLWWLT